MKTINRTGLKKLLDAGTAVTLVDVTPEAGGISNSRAGIPV
jgi:hypothetical protein